MSSGEILLNYSKVAFVFNPPEGLISETGNESFKDKILSFLQTAATFVAFKTITPPPPAKFSSLLVVIPI